MQSVAVHSHKGGVGKTTLCVNIAVELAKKYRVVLIDNDLSGPSLHTFFVKDDKKSYFNQYLNKEVEIEDSLHEFADPELGGKLYYCLSNPSNKSLGNILRLDKKTATMMLRQLMNMKTKLRDELEIDYLIVDTSPGVNITSVNAFVATDNILFVNKLSNADIEGSANMISGILDYIDNQAYMVANQIPVDKIQTEDDVKSLIELIQENLKTRLGNNAIDVVGILPMDMDLQLHEFDSAMKLLESTINRDRMRSHRYIYALDKPKSDFSLHLIDIIDEIFR